ncbi:MAG: sulfatase-like hydrolase/transferase [Bacteroidota bacterium]
MQIKDYIMTGKTIIGLGLLMTISAWNNPQGKKENTTNIDDQKKPNVILIMADDMGYECLGTYGSAEYQTPNLDKMAEEGVKFQHCYSQPLCTPSRVKIMTGKYNYRNYTHFGLLPTGEKTFGNMMKEAGYATCIAGKWQLNGHYHKDQISDWDDLSKPKKFGFDEHCLWQVTKNKGEGKERYGDPLIVQNEKELTGTEMKYGPDIFCNYIIDFVERKKDTNFFVYFPMVLVHSPFVPTPDSEEWADTSLWYKADTSFYADMMNYTDKIVGKINTRLEELGLAENTLVMFTGDNGTDRSIQSTMKDGTVIQGGKGQMNDYGTLVPFIAWWKGHSLKGEVNDELVDFADFLPTLADLANYDITNKYPNDGQSFLPLVTGKGDYQPKEHIFMHYDPKWGFGNQWKGQFVRDKKYKLYRNGNFYDVANDPLEQSPLDSASLNEEQKKIRNKFLEVFKDKPLIQEQNS